LTGSNFNNVALGFHSVVANATGGGNDTANLYDSAGNDSFYGSSNFSSLSGQGFSNAAYGFATVNAFHSSGSDSAALYDSTGDDHLLAVGNTAQLTYPNSSVNVQGFQTVNATSSQGGNDTQSVRAIDFALKTIGNWMMG
jgi:hypothetical protein